MFRKSYALRTKPAGALVDWGDPINYRLCMKHIFHEGGGLKVYDITRLQPQAAGSPNWTVPWTSNPKSYFGPSLKVTGTNNGVGTSGFKGALAGAHATWTIHTRLYMGTYGGNNANFFDGNYTGSSNVGPRIEWDGTNFSIVVNFPTLAVQTFTAPAANTWADLTLVCRPDTTNFALEWYVNGILKNSTTGLSSGQTNWTPNQFILWGVGFANTRPWPGVLDTGSIWARALKAPEIARLRTNPLAGIYSPPVLTIGRAPVGAGVPPSNSGMFMSF